MTLLLQVYFLIQLIPHNEQIFVNLNLRITYYFCGRLVLLHPGVINMWEQSVLPDLVISLQTGNFQGLQG